MPRVLLFAPCQKALLDQDENTASLIGIVESVTVTTEGVPLPADSAAVFTWAIFTLWVREPQDHGRSFEQKCRIVHPDGRVILETPSQVFQLTARFHRVLLRVNVFPVDTAGEYTLELIARDAATPDEAWNKVSSFPIYVQHSAPGVDPLPVSPQ